MQRQLGAALGIAALSSVLAAAGAHGGAEADPAAYRLALFVAAGFAVVGAVAALGVPDEEAHETMLPRRESPSGAGLHAAETA